MIDEGGLLIKDLLLWINQPIEENKSRNQWVKDIKTWKDVNGVDLVCPTVGDQNRYEVEKKNPKYDDPPPYTLRSCHPLSSFLALLFFNLKLLVFYGLNVGFKWIHIIVLYYNLCKIIWHY